MKNKEIFPKNKKLCIEEKISMVNSKKTRVIKKQRSEQWSSKKVLEELRKRRLRKQKNLKKWKTTELERTTSKKERFRNHRATNKNIGIALWHNSTLKKFKRKMFKQSLKIDDSKKGTVKTTMTNKKLYLKKTNVDCKLELKKTS